MDIKEIVNLLYTAIDLAADGGPEAFTDEEYSEMHELLKKIKYGQFGWHPGSELPTKDGEYIVICEGFEMCPFRATFDTYISDWSHNDVKYWCYPPKNE